MTTPDVVRAIESSLMHDPADWQIVNGTAARYVPAPEGCYFIPAEPKRLQHKGKQIAVLFTSFPAAVGVECQGLEMPVDSLDGERLATFVHTWLAERAVHALLTPPEPEPVKGNEIGPMIDDGVIRFGGQSFTFIQRIDPPKPEGE